jgi:hypothetical protein
MIVILYISHFQILDVFIPTYFESGSHPSLAYQHRTIEIPIRILIGR